MPDPVHRKIIHIDMDAFYASVEQRDDPSLRGAPIAVGGSSDRGVVMTASYEARRFGVHSAMPSARARRLCPGLIFVKPRFEAYKEASGKIRDIFSRYARLVEPLSLDEAFLDVTEPVSGPLSATLIARSIKRDILTETGLTASAGVSINKFLAKVASDFEKPDGLTVVRPGDVEAFIAKLPVERFFGVGPATARRLKKIGIHNGSDLRTWEEHALVEQFGKAGHWFYRVARGIDNRAVATHRTRKSVGAERTFFENLTQAGDILARLRAIADDVGRRMAKMNMTGRTVTVKIRDAEFNTLTRSHTARKPLDSPGELFSVASRLLADNPPEKPVRLLGISVSSLSFLDAPGRQLDLELSPDKDF
ncbi:MAG: DNA polymerase IV [Rhodothermales bacterium]